MYSCLDKYPSAQSAAWAGKGCWVPVPVELHAMLSFMKPYLLTSPVFKRMTMFLNFILELWLCLLFLLVKQVCTWLQLLKLCVYNNNIYYTTTTTTRNVQSTEQQSNGLLFKAAVVSHMSQIWHSRVNSDCIRVWSEAAGNMCPWKLLMHWHLSVFETLIRLIIFMKNWVLYAGQ